MDTSSTVTSSPEPAPSPSADGLSACEPSPFGSTSRTRRSSSSPSTSVSVCRCSKRRMLTTPVVITWPDSTPVTRVIGRKIRRRLDHFDDQAQHPRRPAADPQHHHDVADPAHLVAVGVEDGDAGEVRDEDPGGACCHERASYRFAEGCSGPLVIRGQATPSRSCPPRGVLTGGTLR